MRVAVDVGGTNTRIATVRGARVHRLARYPTPAGYDAALDRIAAVLRDAAPATVGVSVAARLTGDEGAITVALNLPDYVGRPLAADLADRLGGPVRVAHDATCGLLGEHAYGALRGYGRCGFVVVSTGIGSALRLGGTVLSTEAGHQILPGRSEPCRCGQTGCLQTVTGGEQIGRRFGVDAASVDDPAFWAEHAAALAVGLANFALCAGLDAIALGGAIALDRAELWPLLTAEVARIATYRPPVLRRAALGADAPLVGAATLADTADTVLH